MHQKTREQFLARLQPGVVIIPAAHEATRSNDTEFPFRQDSDFQYLTGFPEPDAIAVLRPGHEKPYVLFVRPKDREREIWTGIRAGVHGAVDEYGADEAYELGEWETKLPELLRGNRRVYVKLGHDAAVDEAVIRTIADLRRRGRQGVEAPSEVIDPAPILAEMRLFKRDEEVGILARACDISVEGHLAAMRQTRPDMNEYEVQALVEYEFRKRGASAPGYGTIVAGGANATILHYVENNRPLRDGDLLLIDAGAEFGAFTGDITRTFPVGKKFEGAARDVYQVVLDAQHAALKASKPGSTLDDVHNAACRALTQGLVELKVLEGDVEELLREHAYRPYYMHRTSHWLGMDVHDVGAYVRDGEVRSLEAGMAFTVEPGLYFHGDTAAPAHFHGIGVRIEDNVLITPDGHRNLTAGVPTGIAEIEALRGEG